MPVMGYEENKDDGWMDAEYQIFLALNLARCRGMFSRGGGLHFYFWIVTEYLVLV
jgi:hypothetical protein